MVHKYKITLQSQRITASVLNGGLSSGGTEANKIMGTEVVMIKGKGISLKENMTAYLLLLPAMAMFLIFVCLPAVQSFTTSFTQWEGIGPKKFIGVQNYVNIFVNNELFWTAIKNNILWAVCSATIPLWIGLFQANLLIRGKVKYANIFQLIFFLPQIISTVVAAIIWKWIYDPNFGPLNVLFKVMGLGGLEVSWLGNPNTVMIALFVIYSWLAYGFCTVVFCAAIQGVDEQLYEASRMDGCGSWRQFWSVTLPCIRQSMTTVLLLMIIWSFQVFDLVFTTTQGGPGYSSYVISYYVYYEGFIANHAGYATALSITLTVIILTFSWGFMRVRERSER